MSTKFWIRLAGCIVTSSLWAGQPDYRAGGAAAGRVKAVVLEDRRGTRAAVAQADFVVTRAVADLASVQLLKCCELDRAAVVLSGTAGVPPGSPAQPNDLLTAISAALGRLEPAAVTFNGESISVTAPDGRCLASFFPLAFERCRGGKPVRSPIRAAFQIIDLTHPLQQRGEIPPAYPIQAVAFGKQATILALGGEAPADRFRAPHRLVVTRANDSAPYPDEPRLTDAIRRLLERVR